MNSGFGIGATRIMQGNVTGDRYGWKALVAFNPSASGGTWTIQRYRAFDTVSTNTWAGFPTKPPIRYVPLTLGSYQTYDSGDPAVIDEHLNTISGAEIDWLLLDETNGLNNVSGAILNRAKDLVVRIGAHNAQPSKRDIRYAFAIGQIQFAPNRVQAVEEEAAQIWTEFANNAALGGASNYYHVAGKPLLVVYASPELQNQWKAYTGDKTASNHFTVRFAPRGRPASTAGSSTRPVRSSTVR